MTRKNNTDREIVSSAELVNNNAPSILRLSRSLKLSSVEWNLSGSNPLFGWFKNSCHNEPMQASSNAFAHAWSWRTARAASMMLTKRPYNQGFTLQHIILSSHAYYDYFINLVIKKTGSPLFSWVCCCIIFLVLPSSKARFPEAWLKVVS